MWPEFNRKVTRVLQVQKQITNSLETSITTTSIQLASDQYYKEVQDV